MPVTSDAPAQLYSIAWIALLAIFIAYILAGVSLHWRVQRKVRVTRYDPPQGISPAVTAFLVESGRCERSFAAAIVSLATKGYMRVLQKSDWVTFEKLRDADSQLPPEESGILSALFPGATGVYTFNASDTGRLFETYSSFRETVQDIATPELMSNHGILWFAGLICSLTAIVPIVIVFPRLGNGLSPAAMAYLVIMIFVGGSCFVAALRVWPGTLGKIASFLPGRGPRQPFTLNDAIPLFLTVTASVGFMFVAVLTSSKLACLVAAALAINVFTRHLMVAPTSAGRKALVELESYREFLSRTDAARLDRQAEPGKTPGALDTHTSYAVALQIEHGWGQELVDNLLELLQVDQAYNAPRKFPIPDDQPIVLKLFDRDTSSRK
jgi:hypothetical protein